MTDERQPGVAPGRVCPLHYRYAPQTLARAADLYADTVYIVGGLYGNRAALDALAELAADEPGPATIVFNGDFNWFNIDPDGFAAVNARVLQHVALRGNVETEIAGEDDATGCGCAYPAWVSDAEVSRSNEIIRLLRAAARMHPVLRDWLAQLPMHLVVDVDGVRVAVLHGDASSLAGWDYSQEALTDPVHGTRVAGHFDAANVRVIASSHTCLPVAHDFLTPLGHCAIFNNGAAGMPNFRGERYGLVTRIATTPARTAIYGTRIANVHVDAVPLHYDTKRFEREFLANWPPGSVAHASYFERIARGPAYDRGQAVRGQISAAGLAKYVEAVAR